MNDGFRVRTAAVSRGSAREIGSSSCHAGSTSGNGAVDRRSYVAISRILTVHGLRLPARGIDRVTVLFESGGHESVMLLPVCSQPSPRAVCIRDDAAARVPFSRRQGLAPLPLN